MSRDTAGRCTLPADLVINTWTAPQGWPLRTFLLAARTPARGNLLFLGGRGDFFEKYIDTIEYWALCGWNVVGFDWRGQGGSGLLHPDGLCHLSSFSVLVDDLAHFVRGWQADLQGPYVAIAHSMGAHVALRAVAQGEVSLAGLVLLSPMAGLRAGPLHGWPVDLLGLLGDLPPLRQRPVWQGTSSPGQRHLTTSIVRHADKLWWKAQRPDLARGAPTWGWVAAANRSIRQTHRLLRRSLHDMPTLILSGDNDRVVAIPAIHRLLCWLTGARYIAVAGARHELLRERDRPRTACLNAIDAFLATLAPSGEGSAVPSVARLAQSSPMIA